MHHNTFVMNRFKAFLLLLFSVNIFISCSSETNYQQMVKRGLESGVQKDSLFLGYYFGMDRETFRVASWEMNRDGLITGFVKIEYIFDDLKSGATKLFYPDFTEDKISKIPVVVSYNAWAPWNREYWPEELIQDLIEYYSEIYGGKFHHLFIPELNMKAFVNIQGNREIRIYRHSENAAAVDFINLNVHNTVKE
jgi:hypothetical protein